MKKFGGGGEGEVGLGCILSGLSYGGLSRNATGRITFDNVTINTLSFI